MRRKAGSRHRRRQAAVIFVLVESKGIDPFAGEVGCGAEIKVPPFCLCRVIFTPSRGSVRTTVFFPTTRQGVAPDRL